MQNHFFDTTCLFLIFPDVRSPHSDRILLTRLVALPMSIVPDSQLRNDHALDSRRAKQNLLVDRGTHFLTAMAEKDFAESTKSTTSVTRFVCISDTHDNYDFTLPEGDILLHSGDFTQNGTEHEIERFFNWLKTLKQYRLKIFIVGNHESKRFYTKKRYKKLPAIIEQIKFNKSLLLEDGIVYLQEQTFHDPLTGWKFYGRYCSNRFFSLISLSL